ncbi:hypothetical protein M8J77_014230 [Diaphorina citri]|nr:hypothetical protein M8J77_014230 [Diaphorina citri]
MRNKRRRRKRGRRGLMTKFRGEKDERFDREERDAQIGNDGGGGGGGGDDDGVIVLIHQNDDIKLCSNAKSNCYSEHMFFASNSSEISKQAGAYSKYTNLSPHHMLKFYTSTPARHPTEKNQQMRFQTFAWKKHIWGTDCTTYAYFLLKTEFKRKNKKNLAAEEERSITTFGTQSKAEQ